MLIRFLKLGGWASHRHLLLLAFPMILANITTPLVGMVDTAVLGHIGEPSILAGCSIAALIFTQIIWVCGFIRMSTTGQSAQALGAKDKVRIAQVFWQGFSLASVIGVILFIVREGVLDAGLSFANLSTDAANVAIDYFLVRSFSFPAALMNLTMVGWLIGQQQTRRVLLVQVVGNCVNVSLNFFFVYELSLGVKGVATATVISEVLMCVCYLYFCGVSMQWCKPKIEWFQQKGLNAVFSLNANMLLRNLVLQICIAFITLQGTRHGVVAVGINAILMQFFALIALGLDGIAYAVEALVGKAKGARSRVLFFKSVSQGLFWSCIFAVVYAVIFSVFGTSISKILTSHADILDDFQSYLWILILLPLLGHWCFFFDGVAVGLTRSKAMRDTLFGSFVLGFMPIWWLFQDKGNIALWIAMLIFVAFRGGSLAYVFYRDYVIRRHEI